MQNENTKVTVTPSKFAMWRTAISLAYCDGQLSNSETSLIYDWWGRFQFSYDQMTQLENDMKKGVNFEEVWPGITDKLDRAHLINFSTILFHIDGDYSELEQKLFEVLNDRHMATIDYKQAWKDANKAAKEYLDGAALQRAKDRNTKNPFLKGALYLVDSSMEKEEFDKTVW